MRCRIANINIEIRNTDPATEALCADFLSDFDRADIVIPVTPFEVKREMEESPYNNSFAYTESFLAFKKLSCQLAAYDAFLMHGAVVKVRGKGIIFSAPSGTGKTTHMLNWKKLFGDLTIINGDKPIIRFIDNQPKAYGSPWCGKEGYAENDSVVLTDICFIERASENSIHRLSPRDAVSELIGQTLIPKNSADALRVLGLVDDLLKKCAVWKIYCTKDTESAVIASDEILNAKEQIK